MKKVNLKSFIAGLLVGTIGITTVFAAGGIKSAIYNTNKVIYNGVELDLKDTQMISVVKEGEQYASNYMPVRAVLEAMGYDIEWDGSKGAVIVNDKKTMLDNTKTESIPKQETKDSVDVELYMFAEDMKIPTFLTDEEKEKGYIFRVWHQDIENATTGYTGYIELLRYVDGIETSVLIIPREETTRVSAMYMLKRSYYESVIKPLLEKYNK